MRSLPKLHSLRSSGNEVLSDKSILSNILQNNWSVLFKSTEVKTKTEELLPVEVHWRDIVTNATCGPDLDSGRERYFSFALKDIRGQLAKVEKSLSISYSFLSMLNF